VTVLRFKNDVKKKDLRWIEELEKGAAEPKRDFYREKILKE
jgi:hypothetical protein